MLDCVSSLFTVSSVLKAPLLDIRYGGWSSSNFSPSALDLEGTPENLVVWYNNKGRHALPAYVNAAHNAILRARAR